MTAVSRLSTVLFPDNYELLQEHLLMPIVLKGETRSGHDSLGILSFGAQAPCVALHMDPHSLLVPQRTTTLDMMHRTRVHTVTVWIELVAQDIHTRTII